MSGRFGLANESNRLLDASGGKSNFIRGATIRNNGRVMADMQRRGSSIHKGPKDDDSFSDNRGGRRSPPTFGTQGGSKKNVGSPEQMADAY